ncbi:hypothetical protein C0J52_02286 [Blattella germanica]|nr:hypothetical protein C0J52_02286 [Blattella germanica]
MERVKKHSKSGRKENDEVSDAFERGPGRGAVAPQDAARGPQPPDEGPGALGCGGQRHQPVPHADPEEAEEPQRVPVEQLLARVAGRVRSRRLGRRRPGRVFSAPRPPRLLPLLLHPGHHPHRAGGQPAVVRRVPQHAPQDAQLQLLPGGAGPRRLRLPGDAAPGVAQQQRGRAGVQQGRLVPGPRVRQLRVQLPQRVAHRGVHGGALHRRPVPAAPAAHVHGGARQAHRGQPGGHRPRGPPLLLCDGGARAPGRRLRRLRHARGAPRRHARHQHRRQPRHSHRAARAHHRHEHHDHTQPAQVQPPLQAQPRHHHRRHDHGALRHQPQPDTHEQLQQQQATPVSAVLPLVQVKQLEADAPQEQPDRVCRSQRAVLEQESRIHENSAEHHQDAAPHLHCLHLVELAQILLLLQNV